MNLVHILALAWFGDKSELKGYGKVIKWNQLLAIGEGTMPRHDLGDKRHAGTKGDSFYGIRDAFHQLFVVPMSVSRWVESILARSTETSQGSISIEGRKRNAQEKKSLPPRGQETGRILLSSIQASAYNPSLYSIEWINGQELRLVEPSE